MNLSPQAQAIDTLALLKLTTSSTVTAYPAGPGPGVRGLHWHWHYGPALAVTLRVWTLAHWQAGIIPGNLVTKLERAAA